MLCLFVSKIDFSGTRIALHWGTLARGPVWRILPSGDCSEDSIPEERKWAHAILEITTGGLHKATVAPHRWESAPHLWKPHIQSDVSRTETGEEQEPGQGRSDLMQLSTVAMPRVSPVAA